MIRKVASRPVAAVSHLRCFFIYSFFILRCWRAIIFSLSTDFAAPASHLRVGREVRSENRSFYSLARQTTSVHSAIRFNTRITAFIHEAFPRHIGHHKRSSLTIVVWPQTLCVRRSASWRRYVAEIRSPVVDFNLQFCWPFYSALSIFTCLCLLAYQAFTECLLVLWNIKKINFLSRQRFQLIIYELMSTAQFLNEDW